MQPAASAGAVFHVESMNGAFHGVITTAGPLGMRMHAVGGAVRRPRRAPRSLRRGRHTHGSCGRRARSRGPCSERSSIAMSRALDLGERARRSRRSGRRGGADARARPAGPSAAQAGKASSAARDRQIRLARPAAGDLREHAARRSARRPRSVASLATRSPPMKWSGETSTPATVIRALVTRAGPSRSPGRRPCSRT